MPQARGAVLCLVLAVIAGLAASRPWAQTPPRPIDTAVFDTTFRDWMTEHGIAQGVLVVGHRGRLVLERGYGGQDPKQRVLLASLSKAITGRCVAALVDGGRLRLDSKAGDVLAPFFGQHGEPADARLKDATVGQLLVHRGGFPAAPRDLMTPAAVELLQTRKSPTSATPAELLAATLTAPLASAPGEAFSYSNIGYLALGVMVATVTGETYEQYCGRQVLEWAGIKAPALDHTWRAFSSFGGWSLSGTEYVTFLEHDRLSDALRVGTRRTETVQDYEERRAQLMGMFMDPHRRHAATGAPAGWAQAWYGFGQFSATLGPEARIDWHTGSWGVAPDTIGMQAGQRQGGASWFVWYTPRPAKVATDALLERMTAAAGSMAR